MLHQGLEKIGTRVRSQVRREDGDAEASVRVARVCKRDRRRRPLAQNTTVFDMRGEEIFPRYIFQRVQREQSIAPRFMVRRFKVEKFPVFLDRLRHPMSLMQRLR